MFPHVGQKSPLVTQERLMDYILVKNAGFRAYCDALIARNTSEYLHSYLFSLIGTPSHIKAISAHLFSNNRCTIVTEDGEHTVCCAGTVRAIATRKIDTAVNKILVSANYFHTGPNDDDTTFAVVYGHDFKTVQKQTFLRFDNHTTVPLKENWIGWLWDNILFAEKLYSYGHPGIQEAYFISWPSDEELLERVLQAIKDGYLN